MLKQLSLMVERGRFPVVREARPPARDASGSRLRDLTWSVADEKLCTRLLAFLWLNVRNSLKSTPLPLLQLERLVWEAVDQAICPANPAPTREEP